MTSSDPQHIPFWTCFETNWWNHGLCSEALIVEAEKRAGKDNVRIDADGVMWVWEQSCVSEVQRTAGRSVMRVGDAEGEWWPIDSAPKDLDLGGLSSPILLGFAPDEEGHTLPSREGFWREASGYHYAGWVTSIDPNVPRPYIQPTHWQLHPSPPRSIASTPKPGQERK